MEKTLLLIDGSSFIFRAFHAMPNLTSPSKTPTGATYGIINMLKQMLKKYDTPYWGCIFDAPGKTFRDEIYPDYKANRSSTPEELIPQFKDIYEVIPALGIPMIIHSGVEADDVIGTIAISAKEAGFKVVIATGDKDFAQLVDEDITLINTMNNELLDYNGVVDKFGVKPTQIIDYLALVGDKVDNVPGVDKCGPKTAVKWLTQYQSLENVMANADKISGVVGENLRKALDWLGTAKTLVTIDTNVDLSQVIPNGVNHLVLTPPQNQTLSEHYLRLGFKTWFNQISTIDSLPQNKSKASHVNTLQPDLLSATDTIEEKKPNQKLNSIAASSLATHATAITNTAAAEKPRIIITNKNQLHQLVIQIIKNNDPITMAVIPAHNNISIYLKYIFIATTTDVYIIQQQDHTSNDLFDQPVAENAYHSELNMLFESKVDKTLLNYKDSLHVINKCNMTLNNVNHDITLAHYILNSKLSHKLNFIYKEMVGLDVVELPLLNTKTSKEIQQLSDNQDLIINNYSTLVEQAQQVEKTICKNMDAEELELYQKIELPLAKILVNMENEGITLDTAKFKILETEISAQLAILEDRVYKKAQCVFNINSTKQLQDVLFNQLQLPVKGIKKNTHGYSTDEASLQILEVEGISIASDLLEYRGLSKLLNTYVSKLPLLVDSDSKVHTTYDQAIVASGRLSSRDPNLQNIPIKSAWGKRIRQCFIAKAHHVLICADYSQIELRILAHFSQDENLINAFNTAQDVHSITASQLFHKEISQVSQDERRYAKTINFGLLYGKTIFGLANELKIDRVTAKAYIDAYFAQYPKVLAYLEDIKDFARNHGYIKTLFGRKIYLSNINASNKIIREAEERAALNSPMQGTSADIIKIAMVNIDKWLTTNHLKSKMVLQVHDELILHVPDDEVDIIRNNLSQLMVDGFDSMSVKLTTEIKVAHNWNDAH